MKIEETKRCNHAAEDLERIARPDRGRQNDFCIETKTAAKPFAAVCLFALGLLFLFMNFSENFFHFEYIIQRIINIKAELWHAA